MRLEPAHWEALKLSQGRTATPREIDRIAKAVGLETACWAFTQWQLRQRAREKFADADRLLFEAEALEQATHERIAQWRAERFPPGALVADVTAGIGADLRALTWRGPAIGFEIDPVRAVYARHNAGVEVHCTDAMASSWDFEYAFADPSRRQGGRRVLDWDALLPNPRHVAERMQTLRLGAIKLSPLTADDALRTLGPRVEFVSFGRECREALVWTGIDAEPGWGAVHVESRAWLPTRDSIRPATERGTWFFEADPAAIRAHTLGELEVRHGLSSFPEARGYLTGQQAVTSPWLRAYRILAESTADAKRIRAELRSLKAGTPDIKTRNVPIDAMAFRKQVRSEGQRRVAVALFRHAGRIRALILEPV